MRERTAKARESWGSAEGIGPGSRCVCLMSFCKGEGKRDGMGEREPILRELLSLGDQNISILIPKALKMQFGLCFIVINIYRVNNASSAVEE